MFVLSSLWNNVTVFIVRGLTALQMVNDKRSIDVTLLFKALRCCLSFSHSHTLEEEAAEQGATSSSGATTGSRPAQGQFNTAFVGAADPTRNLGGRPSSLLCDAAKIMIGGGKKQQSQGRENLLA